MQLAGYGVHTESSAFERHHSEERLSVLIAENDFCDSLGAHETNPREANWQLHCLAIRKLIDVTALRLDPNALELARGYEAVDRARIDKELSLIPFPTCERTDRCGNVCETHCLWM